MALNDLTSDAKRGTLIRLAVDGLEQFRAQRAETLRVDAWTRGDQLTLDKNVVTGEGLEGWPYMPREKSTAEFKDAASRAPAPWGKLIVSSLAQTVYFESARIEGQSEDDRLDCMKVLDENNWAARQIPLTRATIGHGIAFVKALPAPSPIDGSVSAAVRPVSALRMAAFYDNLDDEWASYTIEVDDFAVDIDGRQMTHVELIDDQASYSLWFEGTIDGVGGQLESDWRFAGVNLVHGLGVPPVVRFANLMDLEGRAIGEIAPILPLLRRIDQDTFDRLIVQRFGAWKVRYIAGLAEPVTDAEKRAQKLRLGVEDLLIAGDPDTKFGAIPETPVKGFIEATDADLRVLAAVTQTPPHHLLGLSSNLQAEALAAAEAGLQRKSLDFQIYNGGSYQQLLRLIATIRGNEAESKARTFEIRYRDTESRSLVQAASALGQLATTLKIPVELLWGRVPGWSDEDTARAKRIVEDGGIDALLAQVEQLNNAGTEEPPGVTGPAANPAGDQGDAR